MKNTWKRVQIGISAKWEPWRKKVGHLQEALSYGSTELHGQNAAKGWGGIKWRADVAFFLDMSCGRLKISSCVS